MFGNSGAKTLLRRRNTCVPMVGRPGHSGLNIFLCLHGSMEGKGYGNGVRDCVGGGVKWTHRRLACSMVESKQCEIARPQELACAPELPPTERSEGCCTGGSLSFQRNRDRRPWGLVSGNYLPGQFASVRPVFHLLTSGY